MTKKETNKQDSPSPFLTLSRQAALWWASGLALMLVLFFFLGTLVGRNMIRVDMGQDGLYFEIAGLTEAENQNTLSEMASMPETPHDFDFYDALNKDVDAGPDITITKEYKDKEKQVVKKSRAVIKPDKLEKQVAVSAKAPEPEPKAAPAPKPAPAPSPAPSQIKESFNPDKMDPDLYKYTIQAASLKSSDEADKLVADLKQKGYPAYWVKGLVRDNELWYRVRVGVYKDRMEAQPVLARLKQDRVDAFFVKR